MSITKFGAFHILYTFFVFIGFEMMKKQVRRILSIFMVIFCLVFQGQLFAADSATEQLKPVLAEIVTILSEEGLKGDANRNERREKVMTSIKAGFDFREMSKRVLGKTWKTISEEERLDFTELMTKLLENVYVGKLEGYSGQDIVFTNERKKGNRAQVTTLIEHEGVELPIHYIMKYSADKWMVYDINIEGVSLVRNYREQFKSILRKEKYAGLVKVLEEKNASFETGNQ